VDGRRGHSSGYRHVAGHERRGWPG
jgi:hypothetical protein